MTLALELASQEHQSDAEIRRMAESPWSRESIFRTTSAGRLSAFRIWMRQTLIALNLFPELKEEGFHRVHNALDFLVREAVPFQASTMFTKARLLLRQAPHRLLIFHLIPYYSQAPLRQWAALDASSPGAS